MNDKVKVTSLINNWRNGNDDALEALRLLVHDELRRLARRPQPGAVGSKGVH